jgi:uncharacterized 2Fe-2S/4Fe-4S cluster protein (DUF4445 family)
MEESVCIELQPLGKSISVPRGTPLREVLPPYGVEFPCGGRGLCDGCRVKVLRGVIPSTSAQEEILTSKELAEGWRLMCRCEASDNVTLDVAQWDPSILSDDSRLDFTPEDGLGVAVDLGTTTLVAQLVDLSTGRVLAVRTSLNPQSGYGADVMSRVEAGLSESNLIRLRDLARAEVGGLIDRLFDLDEQNPGLVKRVVVVGNSAMHHLFSGIDPQPLSRVPFDPTNAGLQTFQPGELAWGLPVGAVVEVLPCVGGFVGGDILAGILATDMACCDELVCLIDLGTNGEIVLGNNERILCASTAAGPAFEGGRIQDGMRASTGAITQVEIRAGRLEVAVFGGGAAKGICGSGLVDAVAAGLKLGAVREDGKIVTPEGVVRLTEKVGLSQRDIRELQLAKAAVAAGFEILLSKIGRSREEVSRVFLAGAFGNYISRRSAARIGLLNFEMDRIVPAGNTALHGAKLALFQRDYSDRSFEEILRKVEHVPLAADPMFQDRFVDAMRFPGYEESN